jgi:GTP-binding protein EngB required for normal cell division
LLVQLHPHGFVQGDALHIIILQMVKQLAENRYQLELLQNKVDKIDSLTRGLERFG